MVALQSLKLYADSLTCPKHEAKLSNSHLTGSGQKNPSFRLDSSLTNPKTFHDKRLSLISIFVMSHLLHALSNCINNTAKGNIQYIDQGKSTCKIRMSTF